MENKKVDPDVAQMSEQLKLWNVKFNNMVLVSVCAVLVYTVHMC